MKKNTKGLSLLLSGLFWVACSATKFPDAGPVDGANEASLDGGSDQGDLDLGDLDLGDGPRLDWIGADVLQPDVIAPDVLAPDTLSPDVGVPKKLGCGVETLAGGPKPGVYDGYRQNARFNNPVNIGALPSGDLLVSDFDNNRIRRITTDGVVTTIAQIARPFGLAVAPDGTVYVQTDRPAGGAATNEGAIWKVDPTSGATTLVLDKSGRARGLAVLADGRLILSDVDKHTISVYDPKTKFRTVLAGKAGVPGFADGTGPAARFDTPYDVLVEGGGTLLVVDMRNGRLRRVSLSTGNVTTFAGTGAVGSSNGPLLSASFNQPKGLALGPRGEIYVSESGGHVVRRIEGGMVTTYAGTGVAGHRDDDDRLAARFYAIEGITVGARQQYLYLADGNQGDGSGHHWVRRIGIPGCVPPPVDAGVPDAGFDIGVDATMLDIGFDIGGDASTEDTSFDIGVDASVDAAVDASADAGVDASADAGVDASADAGVDATSIDDKSSTE